MKKSLIALLMSLVLVVTLAAPASAGGLRDKFKTLKEKIESAIAGEEETEPEPEAEPKAEPEAETEDDEDKYAVEKAVKKLLIYVEDQCKENGIEPEEALDMVMTMVTDKDGNLDLSSVLGLIGNTDSVEVHTLRFNNDPIVITMPDGSKAYVHYSSTPLLRSLRWLPLFYLFIALVLLAVSYFLFRTARTAEQNRIWAGLAKETAHQLGTPISSLTGWMEYLRGKELTDEYASELGKDLHRLETITHRFSKIGSVPELKEEDVREATLAAVEYLRGRTPRRVKINTAFPDGEPLLAPLNNYLFQWVIENLCKNAIDAMEGEGTIAITASQDARKIYLDISDTGRGMSPSVQRHIFDSGFTTKTRGWGLGLPLARRIINQYHHGRLYLKYSIPGQGSCFRIVLKK